METTSPFARLMADLEPLKTNMPEFYNQITMLHQTYQDLMPRVWALNPRDPEREVLLTHCEDIRVNMERMALSLSSTVHPTQDHEHQNSQGKNGYDTVVSSSSSPSLSRSLPHPQTIATTTTTSSSSYLSSLDNSDLHHGPVVIDLRFVDFFSWLNGFPFNEHLIPKDDDDSHHTSLKTKLMNCMQVRGVPLTPALARWFHKEAVDRSFPAHTFVA